MYVNAPLDFCMDDADWLGSRREIRIILKLSFALDPDVSEKSQFNDMALGLLIADIATPIGLAIWRKASPTSSRLINNKGTSALMEF